MKYTIAAVLAVVAAIAGYFGIRHLTRKDLGFTPVKRYASKLAKHADFTPKPPPRRKPESPLRRDRRPPVRLTN